MFGQETGTISKVVKVYFIIIFIFFFSFSKVLEKKEILSGDLQQNSMHSANFTRIETEQGLTWDSHLNYLTEMNDRVLYESITNLPS